MFGPTKGPQKTHYKQFEDKMCLFDWEEFSGMQFIVDKAKDSLSWAQWHLVNGTFPRDDYRELNELIVVYLGRAVPGVGSDPRERGLCMMQDLW